MAVTNSAHDTSWAHAPSFEAFISVPLQTTTSGRDCEEEYGLGLKKEGRWAVTSLGARGALIGGTATAGFL